MMNFIQRPVAFGPVLLLVCCLAGTAQAARVAQVPFDIEVQAPARVRLTITPTVITFLDADPDTTPTVAAQGNPVQVSITGRGSQIALTVRATSHLVAGANTIDISNVTWTATGAGFLEGRLKVLSEVPVGQWLSLSQSFLIQGTVSFFLANSWQYAVGNYQATVIYTATAL